jgi:hypothetical protein
MIFLPLVIIGCDNSTESKAPNYFPLKLGNEWTFSSFTLNGEYAGDFSFKIVKKKLVNGNEYFGFDKVPPGFPDRFNITGLDTIYVRQNDKGDIMLLVDNVECLYFAFSGGYGNTSSNYVTTIIKNTKCCYAFESKSNSISTAVGVFPNSCYIINFWFPQIADDEATVWFAPGYGPVHVYAPEGGISFIKRININ